MPGWLGAARLLLRHRLQIPIVEIHTLIERLRFEPLVFSMRSHIIAIDGHAADPVCGQSGGIQDAPVAMVGITGVPGHISWTIRSSG